MRDAPQLLVPADALDSSTEDCVCVLGSPEACWRGKNLKQSDNDEVIAAYVYPKSSELAFAHSMQAMKPYGCYP